ncbi:MAG: 5-formyltetrahydrofolate cyclo-ligase [Rhodospirillaceae bacterium]|nr:5-formyltetrahydrofolate cyclo-ligase [Rhodospirillaceae bacterium]
MDILEQKRVLRVEAAARRKRARADHGSGAATAVACHAVALAQALTPGWVSGYLAMQDEMDVLPAVLAMAANGWQGCLPVVVGKGQRLQFRAWSPGTELEDGVFGTRHPVTGGADVRPDLLLVPLLAFDRSGYRLGWGGGFYDRTLADLRKSGTPVAAVGVGYSAQEVDAVPRDHYDARLDWVVTEEDIIKIAP